MTIAELCSAIESYRMAAEVNVASSLRVATGIVRNQPVVREVAGKLNIPGVSEHILQRIFELAYQATDHRYENPNDTALMVYLLLLSWHDRELALIASSTVRQVPDLWWAQKVAFELLERRTEQNEMAGEASTPAAVNDKAIDRLFVADARLFVPTHHFQRLLRNVTVHNSPVGSGAWTRVLPSGLEPRRTAQLGVATQTDSSHQIELEAVAV